MQTADIHTLRLVEFCGGFRHVELPDHVLGAAKQRLIDLVGVAVGGSREESSRVVFDVAREQGGSPEAIVWGREKTMLPAASAAFCNGVSAHALELDDVHTPSSVHPGVVVVPAALAVCERERADGKTLLKATVLGYEVMTRVGMAVDPKAHYEHGFHPTSTCGCFGALAAAGFVMGLTPEQFLNGFGIASGMASGLLEFSCSGSWVKRFQAGWATHSGLIAAMLAKKGFTGPPTAITGPYGFLKSHSHSVHPERLSERLGERYEVCNTQIKYYACCGYQHAALSAVIELLKSHRFSPEDVERIDVGVVEPALRLTYEPRERKIEPQSIVDAQFSLPYGVAVTLLFGSAFVDQFSESLLRDSHVLDLARRVFVHHSPALDQYYPKYFPAEVEITLANGDILTRTVIAPKGHPENPLTQDELERRFKKLTGMALTEKRSEHILEMLQRLEGLKTVSELADALSSP